MEWTPAQLSAIETRGKNILVSAAAGSGKTAVLVERIKRLILNDNPEERVPVNEMLVVTFSNAAAAEMREKIIKAINKEILELTKSDGEPKGEPTTYTSDGVDAADPENAQTEPKDPLTNQNPKCRKERTTNLHSQSISGSNESLLEKILYLKGQLDLIPSANISTFHAFCMEVIRKYFFSVDIDPAFKICDDAQKTILRAEALDEQFESLFNSQDAAFLDFLDKYSGERDEDAVRQMILETHDFIVSLPDPFAWLHNSVSALDIRDDTINSPNLMEALRESVRLKLKSAVNIVEAVYNMTSGFISISPAAKADLDSVQEALESLSGRQPSFQQLGEIVSGISFSRFAAHKDEKEYYAEIKDDVDYLRKKAKKIIKEKILGAYFNLSEKDQAERIRATYPYAVTLESLVSDFDARYKMKKKEKGLLDFNDLEHEALHALGHPEIAEEYRNKFKVIFIDEYQDSNFVQESLIDYVKRENNVFMVGDVKQSIYKFRLAEPELFIEKYNRYKTGEKDSTKIDLNMNFRSKSHIINSVNSVFEKLMNVDTAGINYDKDAALYYGVEYDTEADFNYKTELHIMDEAVSEDAEIDEEIMQLKSTEIEAVQAVKIIKNAVGKEVYDAKSQKVRKVKNRDIVILLRAAKRKAEIYASALNDAGIPTYVDQGDGYFETAEVEVFLNLLRIIDNMKQDIPLISILYSPIFGFTVADLTDIRLAHPGVPYYEAFERCADEAGRCADVMKRIEIWRAQSLYMTLEDFIWMLIRETGYMDYVSVLPGSVQRCANLRALVDKAITFQNAKMKGLFSFVNYIELIKKNKIASPPVKLIGENDDVVRIMTVHKSKGLEFPIVILAGLGSRFRKTSSGSGKLAFHNRLGLGLRYENSSEGFYANTLMQTVINEQKQSADIAEELRVLYVAFTRAQDQLILLGTLKDAAASIQKATLTGGGDITAGSSFLDWLLPIISETEISVFMHNRGEISLEAAKETEMAERISDMLRKALTQTSPLYNEINERLKFEYRFAEDVISKSKFSVSEINRSRSVEEAVRSGNIPVFRDARDVRPLFIQGRTVLSRAAAGTALHKVMEHVPFRYDLTTDDIDAVIKDMVDRSIMTEEEADSVQPRLISSFLSSKIGMRACAAAAAGNLRRETPFTLKKGEILIQGIIDCFFEEDDKLILIDYKTNYIDRTDIDASIASFRSEYEVQTELYGEALTKIEGKQVSESYLYSFYLGREIKM